MGNRSLLVIVMAVVFSAIAEFVVNAIDSVPLAWAMLLVLPVAAGSFAGWMGVPGRAGCLVVVLSITAFFVTGALIASGARSASALEETISYVVLGVIMTIFGFVSYLVIRNATNAPEAAEID